MRPLFAVLPFALVVLASPAFAEGKKPRAIRWEEKGLYGQTEERKIPKGKSFDGMVSDYFARMARLCKGDFAERTDPVEKRGPRTLQTAEMACIDDGENPAAAILFVAKGRTFLAITQEGTADQLGQAIARRDETREGFRRRR